MESLGLKLWFVYTMVNHAKSTFCTTIWRISCFFPTKFSKSKYFLLPFFIDGSIGSARCFFFSELWTRFFHTKTRTCHRDAFLQKEVSFLPQNWPPKLIIWTARIFTVKGNILFQTYHFEVCQLFLPNTIAKRKVGPQKL